MQYILSLDTWYKAPLNSAVVQAIGRRPHIAEERVQPSPFHVGFVVDQVQLMPAYIPALRSSPVSTIPPVFHNHL